MPRDLASIQREFFSALLEPLRGRSRESTWLPPSDASHTQHLKNVAARLVTDCAQISALESLELYHRQYWFRILDSIAEDFPRLKILLGDDIFWQLIELYLTAHPSRSFTLRHLGQFMPAFLATWPGCPDDKRAWAIDLARMEYAKMICFEASQHEIPSAEQLMDSSIQLQPHVFLLPCSVNLAGFLETGEIAADEPSLMIVWRSLDGPVVHAEENPAALPLLRALATGGTMDEVLARCADDLPPAEQLRDWFTRWQSRGWLSCGLAAACNF